MRYLKVTYRIIKRASSTVLNLLLENLGVEPATLRYLWITVHLHIHPCKTRFRHCCSKAKSLKSVQGSPFCSRRRREFRSIFPSIHLSEHTLRCPSSDQTEACAVKAVHPRVFGTTRDNGTSTPRRSNG